MQSTTEGAPVSTGRPSRAPRRGRRVLAVLFGAVAVFLLAGTALGSVNARGYLVLHFLEESGWIIALTVVGAALIVTAGAVPRGRRWLVIGLRVATVLLAVLVVAAGTAWGLVSEGFRTVRLSTDVVAVSPDDRFEVVRQVEQGWKGDRHTVLRLRSRAGVLSRESSWEVGFCLDDGLIQRVGVEFAAGRTIRLVDTRGTVTTVAFDADTMRPDRFVNLCPVG